MKKVLFVTIPEKGHINPMIGIAQCIKSKGNEIAFFAQVDVSEQLHKANIHCKCFTPQSSANIPSDFVTQGAQFAEKIKDKHWLRRWIKTLLIDIVPEQIEGVANTITLYQPDIVVTDPMVYASAIACEQAHIPWVGISNSLNPITPKNWTCELVETLNCYNDDRLALFKDIGRSIHFAVSDVISPWLNIVFSTEEYIPRSLSGNNFSFYVGNPFPIDGKRGDETAFPFEQLNSEKKKVYMSLGSQIFYHPQLFKTVAKALEQENVQLILSVSDLYFEGFASEFPKGSIVLPYVPQLEVLKHVDIMISHGGANSVLESLSNGVPIALLPLCNDQFLQAQFVMQARVGTVLNAQEPDANAYRDALKPLLENNNEFYKNAKNVQESFAKYEGAQFACELICQVMQTKKPVMPEI